MISSPEGRITALEHALANTNALVAELAQLRRDAAREIYARPEMTYSKLGELLGVSKVRAAQLVNHEKVRVEHRETDRSFSG